MWKKLDSDYFLRFTHHNGSYEIYITNYIYVWSAFYSPKAFIAQVKDSNDGLELENENEFLQRGLNLFSNLDQLKKVNISEEENNKALYISLKIMFGYPFCFECKLSRGSNEFFFNNVTQPLLKAISDLRSSQSELRRLLIKKDKEIDEYKCEGGEIVLRHLKTAAFNDEDHMSSHNIYEKNFGSSDIPSSLIEKRLQTLHNLKQNSIEPRIKQESSSDANIKQETTSGANIKQESTSLQYENAFSIQDTRIETCLIKQESYTPPERTTASQLSASQNNYHIPRKRMKKLNL